MKRSKKKDKFFPKIEVTRENAKKILSLFAKNSKSRDFHYLTMKKTIQA